MATKQAEVEVSVTRRAQSEWWKRIFHSLSRIYTITLKLQAAEKKTWWQSAMSSITQKEDQEKLSEAFKLSAQEKDKIFEAIGYTEEGDHSEYPLGVGIYFGFF